MQISNFREIIYCFSMTMLLALMVGCSSTPSASDGKKLLADTIQQQSHGLIKLVSFNKTNGQSGEMMGVKLYSMEYDAEMEFLDDVYWGGSFGLAGFEAQKADGSMWSAMGKNIAKKGQRYKFKGQIQFEKTEKGWRGELVI